MACERIPGAIQNADCLLIFLTRVWGIRRHLVDGKADGWGATSEKRGTFTDKRIETDTLHTVRTCILTYILTYIQYNRHHLICFFLLSLPPNSYPFSSTHRTLRQDG